MKPFLLTIDTEPDDPNWKGLSRGAITYAGLEGFRRFGKLAEVFELRPTLLVTYSMAKHPSFEKIVAETGLDRRCEIGMHFHPSDTPPFGAWDPISKDNLLRLPHEILEEKFSNLHAEISKRFGVPRSFRGGAWALDQRLVKKLIEKKYRVDSTVTPGISWAMKGRPSYIQAPTSPYFLNPEHLEQSGPSEILEIPVSILAKPRKPYGVSIGWIDSLRTMPMYSQSFPLMDMFRKLRPIAPQWLRPAFTSLPEMLRVTQGLKNEDYLQGMCHSNEFWPGTSPYMQSASDCDAFFKRLEGLCLAIRDLGYHPMTLIESAEILGPMVKR